MKQGALINLSNFIQRHPIAWQVFAKRMGEDEKVLDFDYSQSKGGFVLTTDRDACVFREWCGDIVAVTCGKFQVMFSNGLEITLR